MLLLFHIFISVVSVAFATYMYLHPAKAKLRITYACIALAVLSGLLLLVQEPAFALQTCLTGMVYLAMVFYCTFNAQSKLTRHLSR